MHPVFFSYVLLVGLYLLGHIYIVTTLKRWHHDTWLRIGSPRIAMFPGKHTRGYQDWRRSGHEQLGDRWLSRVVRIGNVAFWLLWFMTVGTAMYAIAKSLENYAAA